jgi:hypothetical protein
MCKGQGGTRLHAVGKFMLQFLLPSGTKEGDPQSKLHIYSRRWMMSVAETCLLPLMQVQQSHKKSVEGSLQRNLGVTRWGVRGLVSQLICKSPTPALGCHLQILDRRSIL